MSPGIFEAFYQSPIQHPILLWVSNAIGTVWALHELNLKARTRPGSEAEIRSAQKFVLFWALISALDAWASANEVFGIGVLSSPWSAIVPFLFVWLGDFRIFLGMESRMIGGAGAVPSRVPYLRAVGACFVVPILAGVLTRGQEARILFIVYEALFLFWILLYARLTRLDQSPAARAIRNLSLTFYTLWVLADACILFLPQEWKDLGFGIRVIPNFIYYGWFGWVYARSVQ